MFHKATILINIHCQKSVTNIMNNFEIALKFSARDERQAVDVITQASSSSIEYLPIGRNDVDYITRVVLC